PPAREHRRGAGPGAQAAGARAAPGRTCPRRHECVTAEHRTGLGLAGRRRGVRRCPLSGRTSEVGAMAEESRVVRAALVQAKCTGDTASMIEVHESYARSAAEQVAQIMGFQEAFNTPYFCQVQEAEHYR